MASTLKSNYAIKPIAEQALGSTRPFRAATAYCGVGRQKQRRVGGEREWSGVKSESIERWLLLAQVGEAQ